MSKTYIDKKPEELVKIRRELKATIKKHEELQLLLKSLNISAKIVEANLGLLADYADSLDEVKACREAGKCLHNGEYHAYKLIVDREYLTLVPETCPVYYESQKAFLRYRFRDFPQELINYRIKDNPRRPGFASFMRELMAFYKQKSNLIFATAPFDTGSLRYAVSVFNQIVEEMPEVTAAVIDFPYFIREHASDFYRQKEELDILLDQLINIDYLLIHNFGNEEINKLVRDAFTFPLIRERIRLKKPTIILSELSLEDIRYLHDYTGKDVRTRQIIDAIRSNIKEEFTLKGIAL
ncbi:MAG: hypothetical protein WCY90_03040 [Bacilli bacterium]